MTETAPNFLWESGGADQWGSHPQIVLPLQHISYNWAENLEGLRVQEWQVLI